MQRLDYFKLPNNIYDGGLLYAYGPYLEGGTAVESNLNFDAWLKARDPEYGLRNLEDVVELAKQAGLELQERIEIQNACQQSESHL